MAKGEKTYSKDELLRQWILSNPLNFTRYFFKSLHNGEKYVVGRHHELIADALDKVLSGKIRLLMINIAPRYGKTELAVKMLMAMGLALNASAKFIHLSYSGKLAMDNSVGVKDIINSEEYKALFPDTCIKVGSDTKSQWDTTAGGGVYATSSLGQVTGFGAGEVQTDTDAPYRFGGAIIIDDPIKPDDALSDNIRESVNQHFETTIRNRVNSRDTPIVLIMQRLHEHDLCGYLQSIEPDEWEVLSIPCMEIGDDGEPKALWSFKHKVEELRKIEAANSFVFETQYMQNPKPLGRVDVFYITHIRSVTN